MPIAIVQWAVCVAWHHLVRCRVRSRRYTWGLHRCCLLSASLSTGHHRPPVRSFTAVHSMTVTRVRALGEMLNAGDQPAPD
uniref:Putative secreted peptide n=1 Tax=Anopheles braziliensis TaxID=58242 RepID=A0A2M3ZS40_9DIPT